MHPRIQTLLQKYPDLEFCRRAIEEALSLLQACFQRGGKVLLCGNGGSAADAEHMAAELLKGCSRRRSLAPLERQNLPPSFAERLEHAFPAIPLTGFLSFTTAWGNDVDPTLTFAQLVWALGNAGDILVAISTSGESKNVLAAAEVARAKRLEVIGLTGEKGGKLRSLCSICIQTPASQTDRIQELHLPIYHALCLALEDDFLAHQGATPF